VRAIELIVDGYVRLANRVALVDLLAHRHRLLDEITARPTVAGTDFGAPVKNLIEDEIVVIKAGLEKLEVADGARGELKPIAGDVLIQQQD